jgi:WD40 repeat protein
LTVSSLGKDAERRHNNLFRAKSFMRGGPFPVRAFYQAVPDPQLQFDPTGRYLVCHTGDAGREDRNSRLELDFWIVWDVLTGNQFPLPYDPAEITSLAWSPDGKRIAIATSKHELLMADFPSLLYSSTIPETGGEESLAFSPDGKYLACGHGKQAWIWNVEAKQWEEPRLDHPQEVRYVGWSPGSSRLVIVCGFQARVFPVPCPTGQPFFPPVRHVVGQMIRDRAAVWPLFADRGRLLVTVDTHVRWRDIATGEERGAREIFNDYESREGLAAMILSYRDNAIKTATFAFDRAVIRQIQVTTRSSPSLPSEMMFFHPSFGPTSLAHSQDGFFFASGSEDGNVVLETNVDTRIIRHSTSVPSIAFSPASRLLATVQRVLHADMLIFGLIRDSLRGHESQFVAEFWKSLRDAGQPAAIRFRAGLVLANYVPDSSLWTESDRRFVVEQLVKESPENQPRLRDFLRTSKVQWLPEFERLFNSPQLTEVELLAVGSAIADYAADDGPRLARLLTVATPGQFAILFPKLARTMNTGAREDLLKLVVGCPTTELTAEQRVNWTRLSIPAIQTQWRRMRPGIGHSEWIAEAFDCPPNTNGKSPVAREPDQPMGLVMTRRCSANTRGTSTTAGVADICPANSVRTCVGCSICMEMCGSGVTTGTDRTRMASRWTRWEPHFDSVVFIAAARGMTLPETPARPDALDTIPLK